MKKEKHKKKRKKINKETKKNQNIEKKKICKRELKREMEKVIDYNCALFNKNKLGKTCKPYHTYLKMVYENSHKLT